MEIREEPFADKEPLRHIEWQAGDLSAYGTRQSGGNKYRQELLIAAAGQCADYFGHMAETAWASDDDTDYINSHAELMQAVNLFWYDEIEDQLIEWLNTWATIVFADEEWYKVESELGDPEFLNRFILAHIAS